MSRFRFLQTERRLRDRPTGLGIYKLVAAGKIRHERHGMGRGVIRIPKDALDEYREKCTRAELFSAPVKTAKIMRRQFKHLKL